MPPKYSGKKRRRNSAFLNDRKKARVLPELVELEADLFGAAPKRRRKKRAKFASKAKKPTPKRNALDAGKSTVDNSLSKSRSYGKHGTSSQRRIKDEDSGPLWHDSDDDESGADWANDSEYESNNGDSDESDDHTKQQRRPKSLRVDLTRKSHLKKMRKSYKESSISGAEYVRRKRDEFRKVHSDSHLDDWANPLREHRDLDGSMVDPHTAEEESKEQSESLSMFQSSGRITTVDKSVLKADNIAITELGEINGKSPHRSVITSVEFHPNGQLLLTAGLDKTLQLFQMTGKKNVLLKRIFLEDLPIHSAKFTADGLEIIITGRRFYFYVFDLVTFTVKRIDKLYGSDTEHRNHLLKKSLDKGIIGLKSLEHFWVSPNNIHLVFLGSKLGDLFVVSKKSKRVLDFVHLSVGISDVSFNFNGTIMYILSVCGQIFEFHMTESIVSQKSRLKATVKRRWCKAQCVGAPKQCSGILNATVFAHPRLTESSLGLFAVGCTSGVVSLFDFSEETSASRSCLYSMSNLTTNITGVQMSHDGQLTVVWSKNLSNSLKLVHTQSGRVYQNWPKRRQFPHVTRAAFSPHSGYLAIGLDTGYVRLHRVHFYGDL